MLVVLLRSSEDGIKLGVSEDEDVEVDARVEVAVVVMGIGTELKGIGFESGSKV